MKQNPLHRIFSLSAGSHMPIGLEDRVRNHLVKAIFRRKRTERILFSCTLLISFFGAGISFLGIVESDLFRLLALLFEDISLVFAHWQDFSLFFLEILPLSSLIFFFGTVGVLLFLATRAPMVFLSRQKMVFIQ